MVPENRNLKIEDNLRQTHVTMSPQRLSDNRYPSPDACRYVAIVARRMSQYRYNGRRTTVSSQQITANSWPTAVSRQQFAESGQRITDSGSRLADTGSPNKKRGHPIGTTPLLSYTENPGLVLATVLLQSVLRVQDFIPALNGWLGEVFSPSQLVDYTS